MKQIVFLLVLIFSLGLFYALTLDKNKSSEIGTFNIPQLESIHKIEILSDRLENMSITRKGSGWILQRGHLARTNAVDNILDVIQNLQIKYIPERAALQNIQNEMNEIGVMVNMYDKSETLIKRYLIGGSTADERGAYLRLDDNPQPYVVHLPTLEGSIRGRFLMRYDDWRDRTIFDVAKSDIESIEVRYPRQESESFIISEDAVRHKSYATVSSKAKIDSYLHNYTGIIAEAFENINSNQDSIRGLLPFCVIDMKLTTGNYKEIKLYPVENYIEESLVTLENTPRINRYFVDTSWGDFMLVQQRIIGKLLRGYSYFAADE